MDPQLSGKHWLIESWYKSAVPWASVGHMEKQEMEMKWKLETETGNGNVKVAGFCPNPS